MQLEKKVIGMDVTAHLNELLNRREVLNNSSIDEEIFAEFDKLGLVNPVKSFKKGWLGKKEVLTPEEQAELEALEAPLGTYCNADELNALREENVVLDIVSKRKLQTSYNGSTKYYVDFNGMIPRNVRGFVENFFEGTDNEFANTVPRFAIEKKVTELTGEEYYVITLLSLAYNDIKNAIGKHQWEITARPRTVKRAKEQNVDLG